MVLVSLSPFVILIVVQPYLTLTILEVGLLSIVAKVFSMLCAFSAIFLIVISQWEFECSVELLGTDKNT